MGERVASNPVLSATRFHDGSAGGGTANAATPPLAAHRHRQAAAGVDHHLGGQGRVHHAAQGRGDDGGVERGLVGGGELVGQFYDAGLLDELIVQVGSVTLGSGKPLLPRRTTSPSLILESVRAIGPGFAELRYRVPRG